jgi:hypothetical protein
MDTKKKIIVIALLVIGAVGIIAVILYGLSLRKDGILLLFKEQTESPKVVPPTEPPIPPVISNQPITTPKNPFGIEIPKEVYSYTATIKKISKNTITLDALAKDNYLENDTELIVYIDTDTRLEKYSAPLYLPPGKTPKDYKKGTGTIADFNEGDRVTVHSVTNISGVSEFTASAVKAFEFSESP